LAAFLRSLRRARARALRRASDLDVKWDRRFASRKIPERW
jgi:hypothetical protein